MSAAALLQSLRRRGVELRLDGDRLRYRAPPGAYTDADRAAVATQRAALIAFLSGWDQAAADAALAGARQRLDAAGALPGLTPALRECLRIMRGVVEQHHQRHDPLLFEGADWIAETVKRWGMAK
jgi:hypothetical protein